MKVIVKNLATEYKDEGVGKVLLFLHGWQDNLHSFDSLAVSLSSDYRIIRLDLPGFGGTEAPKEVWELNDYAEFVEDFISKLGINVYALIGHSFGGRIAIKGNATGRIKMDKMVLIGSAGISKSNTFRSSILKILAKIGGLLLYIPPFIFWRSELRKKIYVLIGSDYLNAGALKETFLKIIKEDLTTAAEEIKTPTLLIWGENDTETPVSDGRKFSRLIRNSELKTVNGAGHFAHSEKPQEVTNLIRGFL
ncbi:MAG: alpha/beta hydrolase [Candidatus Liptonbacteria bacterium]|nr:alpha/beta hydrolase [Candidatus Liptonbacteria bacterium]